MDENKEAKVVCDAGVSGGGRDTSESWRWLVKVENCFDIGESGSVFLWPHRLSDPFDAVKMTPNETEELARALQFAANAARKVLGAKEPGQ